jgi:hypothetical protein
MKNAILGLMAMFLASCTTIKNGDMFAMQWGGKLEGLQMNNGVRTTTVQTIDNNKSFEDFTTLGGKLGRAKLLYAPAISKGTDLLSKGVDKIIP